MEEEDYFTQTQLPALIAALGAAVMAARLLPLTEFSSCDGATPGSPDDMLLKDLNPCLTPYCAEKKSKEFETMGYESSLDASLSESNTQTSNELSFSSRLRKLSNSSDFYQNSSSGSTMTRSTRRSDESKGAYRKQTQQRHF